MRGTVLVLLCVLAAPASAFATWSVVAVDLRTRRVVIASATCVDQNDEFLKRVQAGVVPGKGVAACQAAGDGRCTCPPWPSDGSKPKIPCDGKTAHVAYILMAEKDDTSGDSHNNGKYAMYLTVSQPGLDHGPNIIKEGENLNPVKTLRIRY